MTAPVGRVPLTDELRSFADELDSHDWQEDYRILLQQAADILAAQHAELSVLRPALRSAKRRIDKALALCDSAEVAIALGCHCRWDDEGNPVGSHGPNCSKPAGWTLDPDSVRAALTGTEDTDGK